MFPTTILLIVLVVIIFALGIGLGLYLNQRKHTEACGQHGSSEPLQDIRICDGSAARCADSKPMPAGMGAAICITADGQAASTQAEAVRTAPSIELGERIFNNATVLNTVLDEFEHRPSIDRLMSVPRQPAADRLNNANSVDTNTPGHELGAQVHMNEIDLAECIGRGGFGAVYKGAWRGAPVAVKYAVCSCEDIESLEAAVREVVLSKKMGHPNVVQTYAWTVLVGDKGVEDERLAVKQVLSKSSNPGGLGNGLKLVDARSSEKRRARTCKRAAAASELRSCDTAPLPCTAPGRPPSDVRLPGSVHSGRTRSNSWDEGRIAAALGATVPPSMHRFSSSPISVRQPLLAGQADSAASPVSALAPSNHYGLEHSPHDDMQVDAPRLAGINWAGAMPCCGELAMENVAAIDSAASCTSPFDVPLGGELHSSLLKQSFPDITALTAVPGTSFCPPHIAVGDAPPSHRSPLAPQSWGRPEMPASPFAAAASGGGNAFGSAEPYATKPAMHHKYPDVDGSPQQINPCRLPEPPPQSPDSFCSTPPPGWSLMDGAEATPRSEWGAPPSAASATRLGPRAGTARRMRARRQLFATAPPLAPAQRDDTARLPPERSPSQSRLAPRPMHRLRRSTSNAELVAAEAGVAGTERDEDCRPELPGGQVPMTRAATARLQSDTASSLHPGPGREPGWARGEVDLEVAARSQSVQSFNSEEGFGSPMAKARSKGDEFDADDYAIQGKKAVMVVVLEYCDLGSLLRAIKKKAFKPHGKWAWNTTYRALLRTSQEIAKGMEYIHSFGIIHGDLKPGNVILKTHRIDRRGYIAKVSDFGLSRPVLGKEPVPVGNAVGTVAYTAPETLRNSCITKPADVYAFGIMMWEMFHCRAAYEGLLDAQICLGICEGSLRPEWDGAAPAPYRALAALCCHHDPARRPTFRDIVRRLTEIEVDFRKECHRCKPANLAAAAVAAHTRDNLQ